MMRPYAFPSRISRTVQKDEDLHLFLHPCILQPHNNSFIFNMVSSLRFSALLAACSFVAALPIDSDESAVTTVLTKGVSLGETVV